MIEFAVPQVAESLPRPLLRPTTAVVIPARLSSTRLPEKPLVDIDGRTMIERVYWQAASAPGVDTVIVATDDLRILEVVERSGGKACLTDPRHPSGTDRVAEVARGLACDIVVNVQGDLPLVDPLMIAAVIAPLAADAALPMSTLRKAITAREDWLNPNVVKVVTTGPGDALYFSRSPLPYWRQSAAHPSPVLGYRHIGLYGYRRDFLQTISRLSPTPLEMAESLEQLRVLEHGYRIRTTETSCESIEVDTPEDLERVRQYVRAAAHAVSAVPGAHDGPRT